MEYDIHTLLDFLTLFATLWVIYELRFPLAASYQAEQDSVLAYYVAVPCLIIAGIAHPRTHHPLPLRVRACCMFPEHACMHAPED
jgi:ER lumen protein retaining receptor